MRVLRDENLPLSLGPFLTGHEVVTVRGLGWTGVKNGAHMIARAAPAGVSIVGTA